MFAKTLITITVLDDACKLLKSWNRPSRENYFPRKEPIIWYATKLSKIPKNHIEL